MSTDALLTVAEIAGTFAGLVALASLIKTRPRGDVYLLGMIEMSLFALVFALLPVLISASGRLEDSVLRPCAGLFLLTWSLLQVRGYLLSRATFSQQAAGPGEALIAAVMALVQLAGIVLPAILLSPWLPTHSATLYSLAVLCPLLATAFILWMTVREIAIE